MLVLNTFTCAAEFTQVAAIEALRDSTNAVDAMTAEYRKRRDLFVSSLNKIPGFRCQSPDGAFYAWVNVEDTGTSRGGDPENPAWKKQASAAIAGAAFGAEGKNFLRFSLVSARNLLEEALERIQRVSFEMARRSRQVTDFCIEQKSTFFAGGSNEAMRINYNLCRVGAWCGNDCFCSD